MPDTARPAPPDPVIYSIVYSSRETAPFSVADLQNLLTQSRSANDRASVTGVLLYRRGRFVQYLEGEEDTVRDLMQQIGDDPRHGSVRVLMDDTLPTRYFPHWTMGFVAEDAELSSMPIGFRVAFNDLDAIADDDAAALRAIRELSYSFRI